jgi:hypothetical protein
MFFFGGVTWQVTLFLCAESDKIYAFYNVLLQPYKQITVHSRVYVCISMYIFTFLVRMVVILTTDHKLKILVHKLKVKINS